MPVKFTHKILLCLTALSALVVAQSATAATTSVRTSGTSWSYSGDTGPEYWGSLSDDFAGCDSGEQQSPIDISKFIEVPSLKPPVISYKTGRAEIVDNGHTIEAIGNPYSSFVTVNSKRYTLRQMHFHSGSEHTINKARYPLEVHFVNVNHEGKAVVIGLLIKTGKPNSAWAPFIKGMAKSEFSGSNSVNLPWPKMVPSRYRAFTYPGSLTTPACNEIVTWYVAQKPLTMSAMQIAAFTAMYSGNFRPVQPLNGRPIQLTGTN